MPHIFASTFESKLTLLVPAWCTGAKTVHSIWVDLISDGAHVAPTSTCKTVPHFVSTLGTRKLSCFVLWAQELEPQYSSEPKAQKARTPGEFCLSFAFHLPFICEWHWAHWACGRLDIGPLQHGKPKTNPGSLDRALEASFGGQMLKFSSGGQN